jgi:hypothetical protein
MCRVDVEPVIDPPAALLELPLVLVLPHSDPVRWVDNDIAFALPLDCFRTRQ